MRNNLETSKILLSTLMALIGIALIISLIFTFVPKQISETSIISDNTYSRTIDKQESISYEIYDNTNSCTTPKQKPLPHEENELGEPGIE